MSEVSSGLGAEADFSLTSLRLTSLSPRRTGGERREIRHVCSCSLRAEKQDGVHHPPRGGNPGKTLWQGRGGLAWGAKAKVDWRLTDPGSLLPQSRCSGQLHQWP